jgi:MFS transporter, NNP family, nitrate/nitrite transporter
VANSNIIALCATLLVRLVAGPCCDRFGPRWTFAGCLVIGAIPTFLAGTCYTKSQLFACRFFVGILGGSFVPCQVWSTGFFDKNIVGTSNAIIAGFGNAGGGVTYFLMPTIYESLVKDQGYTPHVAWRITFIIPGVIILTVASGLFLLCQDTPTGKWADRHLVAQQTLEAQGLGETIVDAPGGVMDKKPSEDSGSATPEDVEKGGQKKLSENAIKEGTVADQQIIDTALGEVVIKPTALTILKTMFKPQVLVLAFW